MRVNVNNFFWVCLVGINENEVKSILNNISEVVWYLDWIKCFGFCYIKRER